MNQRLSSCGSDSPAHHTSLTRFFSKQFRTEQFPESKDRTKPGSDCGIQHGQPFAKNMEPRSPAEIFVFRVVYVNAAPES